MGSGSIGRGILDLGSLGYKTFGVWILGRTICQFLDVGVEHLGSQCLEYEVLRLPGTGCKSVGWTSSNCGKVMY